MQNIVLQFSATSGLLAEWIRWRCTSYINHVDAVTAGGNLLGAQLWEQHGGGVQIRDSNYETFTKKIRVTLSVTDEQHRAFWQFLSMQVGKPYDLIAVIGIALHRDWRSQFKWFCSELIAAALEYAKIIVKIANPVNWIDPQALLEIITASPVYVSTENLFCIS